MLPVREHKRLLSRYTVDSVRQYTQHTRIQQFFTFFTKSTCLRVFSSSSPMKTEINTITKQAEKKMCQGNAINDNDTKENLVKEDELEEEEDKGRELFVDQMFSLTSSSTFIIDV